MQDMSKIASDGSLIRVVNDGETLTVTTQQLAEEEVITEFPLETGSPLDHVMQQRVAALGVAREMLKETGGSSVLTRGSEKIAGIIPEALIDIADYVVTGQPGACERQVRAMDRLDRDMDKTEALYQAEI